jgi:hypothetical protein
MMIMNDLQSVEEQNRAGEELQLLVSGVLALEDPSGAFAIVERGMPILSRDGQEMGRVVAMRVDGNQDVEAILLSRLPLKMEYRVVPAGHVVAVCDRQLILDMVSGEIDGLQKWSAMLRKRQLSPARWPG